MGRISTYRRRSANSKYLHKLRKSLCVICDLCQREAEDASGSYTCINPRWLPARSARLRWIPIGVLRSIYALEGVRAILRSFLAEQRRSSSYLYREKLFIEGEHADSSVPARDSGYWKFPGPLAYHELYDLQLNIRRRHGEEHATDSCAKFTALSVCRHHFPDVAIVGNIVKYLKSGRMGNSDAPGDRKPTVGYASPGERWIYGQNMRRMSCKS